MSHRPSPFRPTGSCADAPQRALDARTLYLMPGEQARVTSTGDALVVSSPQHPGVQRLPVSRLLRIVCNARVDWSGAALSLCMERGISVSWLRGDGQASGHLGPVRGRSLALVDALQALAVGHPGWTEVYGNWLRQQRLALLRRWAEERCTQGDPVGEAEWQIAKQRYVYQGEVPAVLPGLLCGMTSALVASRFSEFGLMQRLWCSDGGLIELAEDMSELLWAEMNFCAGPLAVAVERPQDAAAVFEHWAGRRVGALHGHLCSLRAHAQRELAP